MECINEEILEFLEHYENKYILLDHWNNKYYNKFSKTDALKELATHI